jgi:chemotaxis protein MotB
VAHLQAANAAARQEAEQRKHDADRLAQQLAAAQQSGAAASQQLQASGQQNQELQQRVAQLREQNAAGEAQLQEAKAALAAAAGEVTQLRAGLAEATQKYQELAARESALDPVKAAFVDQVRAALADQPGVGFVEDRVELETDTLFGGTRSVNLTPAGQQQLQAVAQVMRGIAGQLPDDLPWMLRVGGHTDSLRLKPGSAFSSNWTLSAARAAAAADFLAGHRVPGDRLVAAGYGQYQPLVPNDSDEGRRQNRRIELQLVQRR